MAFLEKRNTDKNQWKAIVKPQGFNSKCRGGFIFFLSVRFFWKVNFLDALRTEPCMEHHIVISPLLTIFIRKLQILSNCLFRYVFKFLLTRNWGFLILLSQIIFLLNYALMHSWLLVDNACSLIGTFPNTIGLI